MLSALFPEAGLHGCCFPELAGNLYLASAIGYLPGALPDPACCHRCCGWLALQPAKVMLVQVHTDILCVFLSQKLLQAWHGDMLGLDDACMCTAINASIFR